MKNQKLMFALLVLSLSIMVVNIAVNPFKEAFALQQVDFLPTVTATMVTTTQYTLNGQNLQYFVQVGKFGTSNYIEVYNATNYQALFIDNITGAIGATGKTLRGISCSNNHAMCALAYQGSSGNDRVFLVDVKNNFVNGLAGGRNFTTNNVDSIIYEDSACAGGTFSCNQVFVTYRNAGAGDSFIDNYQTVEPNNFFSFQSSAWIFGYTYDTGFVLDFRQSKLGLFNTTNSAVSTQPFIGEISQSTQLFAIINPATRATKCQANLAGSTDTGDLVYANDTINGLNGANGLDWFVSAGTSVNTAYKFDNSCNLKSTLSVSNLLGTGNPYQGLSYSNVRHELYAYIGGSRNQTIVINATNIPSNPSAPSVIGQYVLQWDSGGIRENTVASSTASGGVIAIAESSLGHIHFIYWTQAGSQSGGGGGGGGVGVPITTPNTCHSTSATPHCYGDINCDTPPNQNILGCQIVITGTTPLGSAGQTVSTSTCFLFNQVGITNDTATTQNHCGGNIKTNGTGYILLGIVFGIMVAVFFLASGGDLRNIPTFIWMIASIGVLGLGVAFGWTDPTFFVIGILIIIALATSKILSTLEIGGKF